MVAGAKLARDSSCFATGAVCADAFRERWRDCTLQFGYGLLLTGACFCWLSDRLRCRLRACCTTDWRASGLIRCSARVCDPCSHLDAALPHAVAALVAREYAATQRPCFCCRLIACSYLPAEIVSRLGSTLAFLFHVLRLLPWFAFAVTATDFAGHMRHRESCGMHWAVALCWLMHACCFLLGSSCAIARGTDAKEKGLTKVRSSCPLHLD